MARCLLQRMSPVVMLWTAPPPARECQRCGRCYGSHDSEELPTQTVSTIGLDITKSVFQIHGVDANGVVVVRRQLKRRCVLAFFEKLAPCLAVSRPVPRHTIGRASCRHSTTTCG